MSDFPKFQAVVVHSITAVLAEGTSEGPPVKPPPEARPLPTVHPFSNYYIQVKAWNPPRISQPLWTICPSAAPSLCRNFSNIQPAPSQQNLQLWLYWIQSTVDSTVWVPS